MSRILRFRYWLALVAMSVAAPLWAGAQIPVIVQSIDDAYNFASPGAGLPISVPITLTFNAHGSSGEGALLTALSASGAGYSIVSGGTCVAGSTTLNDGGPTSCTVIVQYQPSSSVANNGLLTISCSTVAVIGGFSVTCSPGTNSISLLGSVLAAAVSAAPALDARLLTMLAGLLIGIGIYFAARKSI